MWDARTTRAGEGGYRPGVCHVGATNGRSGDGSANARGMKRKMRRRHGGRRLSNGTRTMMTEPFGPPTCHGLDGSPKRAKEGVPKRPIMLRPASLSPALSLCRARGPIRGPCFTLCHTLASVSTKAAARQPRGSQAKNAHCTLVLPSGLRTTKNRIVGALLRASVTSITLRIRTFVINAHNPTCALTSSPPFSCALPCGPVENTWCESALRLQLRRHVETRFLSPDSRFEVPGSRLETRTSDVDTALDYFLFESHASLCTHPSPPIEHPLDLQHNIAFPAHHPSPFAT